MYRRCTTKCSQWILKTTSSKEKWQRTVFKNYSRFCGVRLDRTVVLICMRHITKNKKNQGCCRWRDRGILIHCLWEFRWIQTYFGKQCGLFSKSRNEAPIWPSIITHRKITYVFQNIMLKIPLLQSSLLFYS